MKMSRSIMVFIFFKCIIVKYLVLFVIKIFMTTDKGVTFASK